MQECPWYVCVWHGQTKDFGVSVLLSIAHGQLDSASFVLMYHILRYS